MFDGALPACDRGALGALKVEAGCSDDEYLRVLERHLTALLGSKGSDGCDGDDGGGAPRTRPPTPPPRPRSPPFDLVFYQAGVDPGAFDRLGKLSLTPEGLRRRDALVYAAVARRAAAARRPLPLVVTMGGGYPSDLDPASAPFRAVVEAHASVYVAAAQAAAAMCHAP